MSRNGTGAIQPETSKNNKQEEEEINRLMSLSFDNCLSL